MTILVVVAVGVERDAVLRDAPPHADVVVDVAGVGPVAAATAAAAALASRSYDVVISAGIAGAIPGRAGVGDVVVARASLAGDLGCRTDDGFMSLGDMGLEQPSLITFDGSAVLRDRLQANETPVQYGDIVTLSCMTGTDADGVALAARFPDAVAEAMEGWGVAWAARRAGVPAHEVRSISNIVGRRDPSTWDITGALDSLSRAFAVLLAEPLQ
ncbi:MAG: futalosine hydrolase [Frankiales bacterium]|jgi:futalosine hydrolase|nr:futalosine hydrolase [Frankiales bacterium]